MARLTGGETLFVNGDGFVGDVSKRGFRGVPVLLRKGDNDLYVLGIPDSFELELWCQQTRVVVGTWDIAWPGETTDGDEVVYPAFNASTQTAEYLHVHYENAIREDIPPPKQVGEWNDGWSIIPLGVFMGWNYFGWLGMNDDSPRTEEEPAVVPLCVYANGDRCPDIELLHCAPASERKKSRAAMLPARAPSVLDGCPLLRHSTEAVLVFSATRDLARARLDQELCWYRARFAPVGISGEDLVSVDPGRGEDSIRRASGAWAEHDFVLYGNADVNPAWSRFVAEDAPIQAHAGHLVVNGAEFRGEDICGSVVVRAKSWKRAVVIADTGVKGARLGYLVQPLLSKADGLDYCFWDARGEGGTPRIIASGKLPSTSTRPGGR